MSGIIIDDWYLSQQEFLEWIQKSGSDVRRVIHHEGIDKVETYEFANDEDLVAFKLTFKRCFIPEIWYTGKTPIRTAMYYCPYIPEIK